MKRRSKISGQPSEPRRQNAPKLKNASAASATRQPASAARQDEEIVRLNRELVEAREQQTATSEVLRALSQSEFQLQSVLQSVAESAAKLCRSDGAVIFQLQDGVYRFAAGHSLSPEFLEIEKQALISPGPGTIIGRAAMSRNVVRINDALTDPLYEKKEDAKVEGNRSMIGVPLMRGGEPVVVIGMGRRRVEPFGEREIELAKSFAAQAVIAIENARLLNDLRQRTTDLTEALEQQTATSEVLQVIGGFPGDLQPVFETMLANATRICEAKFGVLWLSEGECFRCVALHNAPLSFAEHYRDELLVNPPPGSGLRRLFETRQVAQVADMTTIRPYIDRDPFVVASVELGGYRSVLNVPMLKEGCLGRRHLDFSPGGSFLHRQAGRSRHQLRGPGSHCHRERATAQRTTPAHNRSYGGVGAADCHVRGSSGNQWLSRRSAAGVCINAGESRSYLRCELW